MGRSTRPPARLACLAVIDIALQAMARAEPALLGRPTAILRAGRVVAASAPARATGVTTGLTTIQARARCLALVAIPADEAVLAATTAALLALLDRFSPVVELAREGVAFLDWGGLGVQPAGEIGLARHLAGAVRSELGLVARIGIADGPFVAAVAAHQRATPDAPYRVPPGAGAAFLAPFDLAVLPGLRHWLPRLRALGLSRTGDLARLPPATRLLRTEPALALAYRLANADDARPLQPHAGPAEREVTITLDPAEDSLLRLLEALRRALRPLWDDLEAAGLITDRLVATLHLETGDTPRLAVPLPAVTGADRAAVEGLRLALDGTRLPAPVAALTLTLAGIGRPRGRQLLLLEAGRAACRPAQLAAVARLWALYGPDGALRLVAHPARLPEDAVSMLPWDDMPSAPPPAPTATPRLLAVPAGLRWVAPPRPLVVAVEGGRPAALRVGRDWRRLAAVDGPYRVATGWWAAAARPVARDYWLAAGEAGDLLLLTADHDGGWALAAEFA